jgi:hypothetical protein
MLGIGRRGGRPYGQQADDVDAGVDRQCTASVAMVSEPDHTRRPPRGDHQVEDERDQQDAADAGGARIRLGPFPSVLSVPLR